LSYFIPQIRDIPIFGFPLAQNWLWTLNPSPAYVGQGIIMGPATTLHMLLGAIIGWGILSPLARHQGWAPGNVDDWQTGSKGWIVWVSLAIMLADSLVSLGWLLLRPTIKHGPAAYATTREFIRNNDWKNILTFRGLSTKAYHALDTSDDDYPDTPTIPKHPPKHSSEPEADAPLEHLISNRTTVIGLILSSVLSVVAIHYAFAGLIALQYTILSLFFAMLLSVMGVRALGETDLNPVSGISKLTQLLFAFIVPRSNPNAIIINLIAGAVSESGALQAGDLMQDLKAGHLLGAAPSAQFWGQMIGSAVGAVVSAVVYKLYTRVYTIPGGLFQVPTGFVWIFTARLVTGKGLPEKVAEWALGAGLLFALTTALRTWGNSKKAEWVSWVPGGIAVAVGKPSFSPILASFVPFPNPRLWSERRWANRTGGNIGMYNTPSFTLARTMGGLLSVYWQYWLRRSETPIIVLASGLILGEGLFSIVNLLLASLHVPHL
jgi:OPT family oligopeptide transporter